MSVGGGTGVIARTTNGSISVRSTGEADARTTNGRITAESDGIGTGAVFRLYLPLGEDTSETWSGLLATREHQGGHTDVLLIDDDEDDRDIFKEAISVVQPEVHCMAARDGEEGLSLLEALTILPDFLFRRFAQGKRIGREITLAQIGRAHV